MSALLAFPSILSASAGAAAPAALLGIGILVVTGALAFRAALHGPAHGHSAWHNVLIVGAGDRARQLARQLLPPVLAADRLVGFIADADDPGGEDGVGAPMLGRLADLPDRIRDTHADDVVICSDTREYWPLLEAAMPAIAARTRVHVASPLYDVIASRLPTRRYGDVPVVDIAQISLRHTDEALKRLADLALTVPLLLLLAPVLAVLGILIRLDSPGPVLHRQTRLGKNGRAFTCYKLRSMRVSAAPDILHREGMARFIHSPPASGGPPAACNKVVDDARVTHFGRWLRRTSLDELPQLLNVLRGDMSLVGPRPCLPYEWEQYDEWHKQRLSERPGCTGLWQIRGRGSVSFDDMVVMDLYYIQNASPLLDLRILLRTPLVMLQGSGAR